MGNAGDGNIETYDIWVRNLRQESRAVVLKTKPPRCGGCGCFTGPFTSLGEGKYCDYCYNRRIKGVPPQGFTLKTGELPSEVTAWLNEIYKNLKITRGEALRKKEAI